MLDIKKSLGTKISRIRKLRSLTQMQLAERVGISTNALSLIETGVGFVTAETLEKIITVLNIQPEQLFSFNDTDDTNKLYNDVLQKIELLKSDKESLDLLNCILNKLI